MDDEGLSQPNPWDKQRAIERVAAIEVMRQAAHRLEIPVGDVQQDQVTADDWRAAERRARAQVQPTGGARVEQGHSWQEIAAAIAKLYAEAQSEVKETEKSNRRRPM